MDARATAPAIKNLLIIFLLPMVRLAGNQSRRLSREVLQKKRQRYRFVPRRRQPTMRTFNYRYARAPSGIATVAPQKCDELAPPHLNPPRTCLQISKLSQARPYRE